VDEGFHGARSGDSFAGGFRWFDHATDLLGSGGVVNMRSISAALAPASGWKFENVSAPDVNGIRIHAIRFCVACRISATA
jgi:hypothetical protein